MINKHIVYTDFLDWQFVLTKAQGPYLWDDKGKRYIDFTSGWNVTNLGWNRPEIAEAMERQVRKNVYAPMWLNDDIQAEYADALVRSLPKGLDAVVRATGGTDANEKALMIARSVSGRKGIVGFRDTYHGHSYGTISIGYRPEQVAGEAPVVPEFIKLDFPRSSGNDSEDKEILATFLITFENILKGKTIAAVVTEAGIVTGWGTTPVAPKGYLTAVRKMTKQYGTLLILDEVGTGFSRCGSLFGMELEDVTPDIATFAKGITNGAAALGACVVRSEFGERELSRAKTHSTFGWTSVGCAAALEALRIHKRENVWEQASAKGKRMLSVLRKNLENHPRVGIVQGLGLEIGVLFVKDGKKIPDDDFAKRVIKSCSAKGLHIVLGGEGNIQLMPPLTIPEETIEQGIDIFISAVNEEGGTV